MSFWIDLLDLSGNKLGDGPITSATSWKQTSLLSKSGSFSFEIPASDPKTTNIAEKLEVRCYTIINDSVTLFGSGIIDNIDITLSHNNEVMLQVSGNDLLSELSTRTVGFLELTDGAGAGTTTALADIIAFAPTGWSAVNYTTTGDTVYGRFTGETVLQALVKVGENEGEHFRVGNGREVYWIRNNISDTGLRAIAHYDNQAVLDNNDVVIMNSLSKSRSSDLITTKVYAFGAGQGSARLTLEFATNSPGIGYTLSSDVHGYYLSKNSSVTNYGTIERFLSWKDISPVSNTTFDIASAGNQLLKAATEYLDKHDEPQVSYDIDLHKVNQILYPGTSLRVQWKEIVDGYTIEDIDEDLIIVESTRQISQSDGVFTTSIKVSNKPEWPMSDEDVIVAQMEEARLMEAHPQIFAGYFPYNFPVINLDSSDPGAKEATYKLTFDNRQTRLVSARMNIRTDVFESTSKGADSETVTLNTATADSETVIINTSTASADGSHRHGIDIGAIATSATANYKPLYIHKNDGDIKAVTDESQGAFDKQTMESEGSHTHPLTIGIDPHSHPLTIGIDPHSHPLTIGIDPHSHLADYGVYRDTVYPGNISIYINGVDRTSYLFGTSTIGTSGSAYDNLSEDPPTDIADLLNAETGGFQQSHDIKIVCNSGRGRVFIDFLCFVQVQAIFFDD